MRLTNATSNVPVFTDYRGLRIGMSAEEVRAKLDGIKKGAPHDIECPKCSFTFDAKKEVIANSSD